MHVLAMVLMMKSYISSSPLTSSVLVVLSMCLEVPLMMSSSFAWGLYVTMIIFISGVMVLMVYFTTISLFIYKDMPFKTFSLLVLLFSSLPYLVVNYGGVMPTISCSMGSLLFYAYCIKVLFLTLLAASYMLSRGEALTSMS